MILRLVDQRQGVGPAFADSQWQQAARLAAVIGKPDWPVDVVLVTDAAMSDLNRRYRQLDAVTDVLSFSYLETQGEGNCDLARGEGWSAGDHWRDYSPLAGAAGDAVGELVLALAFITARCDAEGWPLAVELPWLVVHGCLHLVGWDHEDDADQQAMMAAEAEILAGAGLSHPLRPGG